MDIPGTHSVRRSDDALRFDCETEDNKKGFGISKVKLKVLNMVLASYFRDLGITDAITDKHRSYENSFSDLVK